MSRYANAMRHGQLVEGGHYWLEGAHGGHGGAVYEGLVGGHRRFRCNGCGDTVFFGEAGR